MRTRGSTLVEVLIASVVLVIGLTGIVVMLNNTSGSVRSGTVSSNAVAFGASTLDDLNALGYCAVASSYGHGAGFDAGLAYDVNGRQYTRLLDLFDGGTADVPNLTATVRVGWVDGMGQQRTTTLTNLLVRPGDGC